MSGSWLGVKAGPTASYKGRRWSLARLVWHLKNGPIANGAVIRHTCDNARCINPDHLVPGTQADNVNDMMDRNRSYWKERTHCEHGHALTSRNTYKYAHRVCKACHWYRQRGIPISPEVPDLLSKEEAMKRLGQLRKEKNPMYRDLPKIKRLIDSGYSISRAARECGYPVVSVWNALNKP